jgi:tetratricopeptide (TPR) repeat protein
MSSNSGKNSVAEGAVPMKKNKEEKHNHESLTLPQLCGAVISMKVAYEDVAELIENRTYALCVKGQCDSAMSNLEQLTDFFETMPGKNEENCRDLADIYILIGEVNQYVNNYTVSIEWFKKASVVFDRYAVPFHNLATSFIALGDIPSAVKSLEQEIALEPGNYFSRLRLADLYEQLGEPEKEEECLKKLLSRNPENIQALHKLIMHYEEQRPRVDIELLRKRLIGIKKNFNEIEMVIKTYHLCQDELLGEALDFLDARTAENPAMTVLHLLKAFVFGEMHQFARKRKELTEFKQQCHGKLEYMKSKLDEFGHIFGKNAVVRLGKILAVSNPNFAA